LPVTLRAGTTTSITIANYLLPIINRAGGTVNVSIV
jgi:hypothetical protein